MEFILKTDLEKSLPQVIDFNFEELKKELSVNLKKYKDLVVTEESIKPAKTDKASLNKLRTAIEDKRKEIKKACLAPYDSFEIKIKEIVGMIDEPIQTIDSQLKVFENLKIEEKKAEINNFYTQNIKDLFALLPLDSIYNPRWENATFDIKEVEKEILTAIETFKKDFAVIESLKSEFEQQIKDNYLQTHNLSTALAEKSRLDEQKAKLEEYQKQQVIEVPQPEVVNAEIAEFSHMPCPDSEMEQILEQIDFRVWVTTKQKSDLKKFLTENNIKMGRVQ